MKVQEEVRLIMGWKGSQALWNGGQSCCISSRPDVAVVGVLVERVEKDDCGKRQKE